MPSLAERMLWAAKLEPAAYEDVEADTTATSQAALVVIVSSLCMAIGGHHHLGALGLGLVTVMRLAAWYVWSFVTWLVGTRLLPGSHTEADLGQLLRTLGFASAPGVLGVLGVIPGLQAPVAAVVGAWLLVAMVVAVRQALDYERTGRAVAVVVVGFLCYLVAATLLIAGVAALVRGR